LRKSPFYPIFSSVFSKEKDSQVDTDIMTIKEVSEYLKLAEKTAYRLAAQGKIPGFKIGGSWRFRRSEIDAWIEKQRNDKV
jgi:excisionase family DNA binding protein